MCDYGYTTQTEQDFLSPEEFVNSLDALFINSSTATFHPFLSMSI